MEIKDFEPRVVVEMSVGEYHAYMLYPDTLPDGTEYLGICETGSRAAESLLKYKVLECQEINQLLQKAYEPPEVRIKLQVDEIINKLEERLEEDFMRMNALLDEIGAEYDSSYSMREKVLLVVKSGTTLQADIAISIYGMYREHKTQLDIYQELQRKSLLDPA